MMRARPAVILAEAVAGVPALCGGAGRHCSRHGVRGTVYRVALAVDVTALLNERGRAISDVLRALLRLLRVTGCDQGAIEP